MSIIEGIGDEVFVSFLIAFALELLVLLLVCWRKQSTFQDAIAEAYVTDYSAEDAPPVHNLDTCPICWSDQVFALETNCGHLYCGNCLLTLYEQNVNAIRFGLTCPMCRQEVSLLFICFSAEEKAVIDNAELASERNRILTFARTYNQTYPRGERSWWNQLRDIPILLRHFVNDVWEGAHNADGAVILRLSSLVVLTMFYVILPFDLIPEYAFGIFGLLDDVLASFILLLYVALRYRTSLISLAN